MLGNRELVLDRFCEVYDLLKPWMDFEFYDLGNHTLSENAVYLVGRKQFTEYAWLIKENSKKCLFVLSNPHEGSETLKSQCVHLDYNNYVKSHEILLLGGGDMESTYPCLQYDSFLPKVLDYQENVQAQLKTEDIFQVKNKPYKFLFLNGRIRAHRKYLLEQFRLSGLLNQSLWTNLDSNPGPGRGITHPLMNTPSTVRTLPTRYEVEKYQSSYTTDYHYKKYALFNNEWGEIYLKPEPYIDTYFSLVTETVFEYPYSFRTEKIWKPIAIGHPFIVVANAGYYRDLHKLGFKTFSHVIDESFDQIEDNQKRIEHIAKIVEDLCQQDLAKFLEECYNVCKYNQQHLAEMRVKVRNEFPDRFIQFISPYINE